MSLYLKSFSFAIIALFFWNNTFSQYYHKGDYVITKSRDTVFGILQIGSSIKIRKGDSVLIYDPEELDAYYLGEKNEMYKRRKLPGRTMEFLQCAEQGKINVYIISTSNTGYTPNTGGPGMTYSGPGIAFNTRSKDNVFLEKEGKTVMQVLKVKLFGKPKFAKDGFLSMIQDIQGMKELYMENERHETPDICYYIHEYNLRASGIKN